MSGEGDGGEARRDSDEVRTDGGDDRVFVCDAADLSPGERTLVEARDQEIGVLNVEGEYYALSNTCPHQQGPVCEGAIKKDIKGEFVTDGRPVREYHSDTTTISCPWHGWEYDIKTGEHVGDRRFRVPTYDVVEDDGALYLDL